MADEKIRLGFSITAEDLFQFFLYHHLIGKRRRLMLWGGYPLCVGAAMVWAYISSLHDRVSTATLLASIVVCGVIAALGYPLIFPLARKRLRIETKRFIRQNRNSVGERTLQYSAERVSWQWNTGESTLL